MDSEEFANLLRERVGGAFKRVKIGADKEGNWWIEGTTKEGNVSCYGAPASELREVTDWQTFVVKVATSMLIAQLQIETMRMLKGVPARV